MKQVPTPKINYTLGVITIAVGGTSLMSMAGLFSVDSPPVGNTEEPVSKFIWALAIAATASQILIGYGLIRHWSPVFKAIDVCLLVWVVIFGLVAVGGIVGSSGQPPPSLVYAIWPAVVFAWGKFQHQPPI